MKIFKLITVGAALLAGPAAFAEGPEAHTPAQIASYVEPEGQTPAQVASYVMPEGQAPAQIASYRVREEK
jgi:hypothetical protein